MNRFIAIVIASCAGVVGLSACGMPDNRSDKPSHAGSSGLLVPAPAGRTVVAEVAGVPIYDECVAIQASAHHLDRRAALDECIEFEVLAQEAQRRGLHRGSRIHEVQRAESVRRLLHEEIVVPMPSVERTERSVLEDAYKRYRDKIFAPARRRIFHVYAPFPEQQEPRGTEADLAARKLADELYARLSQWLMLSEDEMLLIAQGVAGDRPIGPVDEKTGKFRREVFKVYLDQPNLPRGFSHATFAIPEVGMVSKPARSNYGWHIILYLDEDPARYASVDQAAEWLFQAVRYQRYRDFSGELGADSTVEIDEPALMRLQERQDELRFPSSETP